MLHLLPIRLLLGTIIAIGVLSVGGIALNGWQQTHDAVATISRVVRLSGTFVTVTTVVLFALWRWSTSVQELIFPYLGGRWEGRVEFVGTNGPDTRAVTAEIKHTLTRIVVLLDSEESTSRTLVVHAERDPDFKRFRLYYAYLNQRKEGVPGASQTYRGLAVLRVVLGEPRQLIGDYFTEAPRGGAMYLTEAEKTTWWKLWR